MQVVSAGADGLLKLWNARTAECVTTFGEHEDKVWALAVEGGGATVATGGSDSLAIVWRDSTAEEAGAAAELAAEELEKETLMGLSVARQDFRGAMDVAFDLRRPHKMMTLLKQLLQRPDAAQQILDLVSSLRGRPDRLQLLLQVRRLQWGTPAVCPRRTLVYHSALPGEGRQAPSCFCTASSTGLHACAVDNCRLYYQGLV